MKFIRQTLAILSLVIITNIGSAHPSELPEGKGGTENEPAEVRLQKMHERLEEINRMDVKSLSRAEKRELRREVRSIKKKMDRMATGGVYISIGSLIIIILLLIILL